jgi:hypothetical protein
MGEPIVEHATCFIPHESDVSLSKGLYIFQRGQYAQTHLIEGRFRNRTVASPVSSFRPNQIPTIDVYELVLFIRCGENLRWLVLKFEGFKMLKLRTASTSF